MKKVYLLLLMLAVSCLSVSAETVQQKAVQQKTVKPSIKDLKIQPQQPDLVISNCRFELTGNNVKAYVTLQNSGKAGATFQMGQSMAIISIRGTSFRCNAPAGGYFLGAGQSVELSTNSFYVASGNTYPGTWTVNPDHVVVEKDFENNVMECQLVGPQPPAQPDLVITGLSVQPSSGPPGTVFKITIVVANQGDATLPKNHGPHTIPWVKLDDSAYTFDVTWAGYIDLAVGQSVTHTISTKTPLAPGTHTISAELDHKHELAEKNENNNTSSCTITVTQ